jgi:hypothetical protein
LCERFYFRRKKNNPEIKSDFLKLPPSKKNWICSFLWQKISVSLPPHIFLVCKTTYYYSNQDSLDLDL